MNNALITISCYSHLSGSYATSLGGASGKTTSITGCQPSIATRRYPRSVPRGHPVPRFARGKYLMHHLLSIPLTGSLVAMVSIFPSYSPYTVTIQCSCLAFCLSVGRIRKPFQLSFRCKTHCFRIVFKGNPISSYAAYRTQLKTSSSDFCQQSSAVTVQLDRLPRVVSFMGLFCR